MTARPDVSSSDDLAHFFNNTARHIQRLASARGASVGVAVAVVITLTAWWSGWAPTPTLAVCACIVAMSAFAGHMMSGAKRSVDLAVMVERRQSHANLIVTAAEVESSDGVTVTPYVANRILDEAARSVSAVDIPALFPMRRALAVLTTTSALWLVTIACLTLKPAALPLSSIVAAAAPTARIGALDITITPPAYMHRSQWRLHDPARIDAPAGSIVSAHIATGADRADIETVDGRSAMKRGGHNAFVASIKADADGYVAIETTDAMGSATDRRMIGIHVRADLPPDVKITAPGHDLHLTDSTKTISVEVEASDDIGLATLILRYTKVSGSGEQYAFSEGAIPLTVTRKDARTWKARADLRLAALQLNKGDMVVYRASTADNRPGASATLSDAFIIEIIAPGNEAMAGFAADDETDKYALSQEMVIQKTERLIRRAPSMNPDSVKDQAMLLAAEQRSVRAEFVFMMGGELAEEVLDAADATELHEEAEAAGESDLAAGRGVNKSRLALVDAIRGMSQANTALTAFDLNKAIDAERRALKSLQAAFSHTRYILRGLTQHERLDLARRLTGDLTTAQGDTRPDANATESPRIASLRTALATAAELHATSRFDANASKRAAILGAALVRIDAASPLMARAATQLNDAAASMMRKQSGDARSHLAEAAATIATALRESTPQTSVTNVPATLNALNGALSDALRRARTREIKR